MMTDITEAWQAGVDAVVADNTLNRGGFSTAIRTVITDGLTNAEANTYIDAVATEFNRLGLINNPTYNNLRGNIIGDPVAHMELYKALAVVLNALPEAEPVIESAELTRLRDERDNVNDTIDRADVLIGQEPAGTVGRQIKDILRDGKQQLRLYKESLRSQIENITGDPDA